jgi:FAD/FMN-containing dehydrogenase
VKPVEHLIHPQPFFYPLDSVRDWNRLYGRRGMVQYQCVIPEHADPATFRRLLEVVSRMGGASPVSVIKDCGPEGRGMISFPMAGMSLALDLPYRAGRTETLVDALNEIVVTARGRIYLTKDALTRRDHFAAMEPRLARWNDVRRKWDPERRVSSALAQRLLDPAP